MLGRHRLAQVILIHYVNLEAGLRYSALANELLHKRLDGFHRCFSLAEEWR